MCPYVCPCVPGGVSKELIVRIGECSKKCSTECSAEFSTECSAECALDTVRGVNTEGQGDRQGEGEGDRVAVREGWVVASDRGVTFFSSPHTPRDTPRATHTPIELFDSLLELLVEVLSDGQLTAASATTLSSAVSGGVVRAEVEMGFKVG